MNCYQTLYYAESLWVLEPTYFGGGNISILITFFV